MSEAEERIGKVEDVQGSHVAQLAVLQTLVKSLTDKVEDGENRQRRNNIWVVGLPEGPQPAVFAKQFSKKLLEMSDMPLTYVVERAHRVPMDNYPSGASPSQIPEFQR